MKIAEEIEILKEVAKISPDLIVGMIAEAHDAHQDNKATRKDKFLLGLRYPEFFSRQSDGSDMSGAYKRAEVYRNQIGIDFVWLMNTLREDYGLA